jgi:tyrosyl-tRNA synthetase
MMMVRHFIDHGHKAYLLVGGATGLVGDPDGKSASRGLKPLEEVAKNKAGIAAQYYKILAGKEFTVVDNYDWFKDMNYLDFLRDIGMNAPMGQMLSRDFVQKRLGSDGNGISYAEFSYSLIQGYDFVYLFRNHGVTLQLCGADQWGNCVTGVDLIRRIDGKDAHIFSMPLIMNKATGVKFGKSEDGAVWLDSQKTSVYKYYQFWLNADDEGVIDYLKVYTLLPKEDIADLEIKVRNNPGGREAQKSLAREATVLVHGKDRADGVERVTSVLFGNLNIKDLQPSDLDMLAAEIPVVTLGTSIVDALIRAKLASSNGEARRLLESGAVSLNSEKVYKDCEISSTSLIKKGKNNFVLDR